MIQSYQVFLPLFVYEPDLDLAVMDLGFVIFTTSQVIDISTVDTMAQSSAIVFCAWKLTAPVLCEL
jgi:hypothetical protein